MPKGYTAIGLVKSSKGVWKKRDTLGRKGQFIVVHYASGKQIKLLSQERPNIARQDKSNLGTTESDQFSAEEINQIQKMALKILKSEELDSPEAHLDYIRKQIEIAVR